jgi:hypothetical protein
MATNTRPALQSKSRHTRSTWLAGGCAVRIAARDGSSCTSPSAGQRVVGASTSRPAGDRGRRHLPSLARPDAFARRTLFVTELLRATPSPKTQRRWDSKARATGLVSLDRDATNCTDPTHPEVPQDRHHRLRHRAVVRNSCLSRSQHRTPHCPMRPIETRGLHHLRRHPLEA